MNIKAAIFDMDGTLADSLKFWGIFWPAIGEKFLLNKDFVPTVAIYDAYNYGQEKMRQIATEYIAPGQTLMRLVK